MHRSLKPIQRRPLAAARRSCRPMPLPPMNHSHTLRRGLRADHNFLRRLTNASATSVCFVTGEISLAEGQQHKHSAYLAGREGVWARRIQRFYFGWSLSAQSKQRRAERNFTGGNSKGLGKKDWSISLKYKIKYKGGVFYFFQSMRGMQEH